MNIYLFFATFSFYPEIDELWGRRDLSALGLDECVEKDGDPRMYLFCPPVRTRCWYFF